MLLSGLRITPLLLNSKLQCHLTCSHQHGELSTPTSLQFLYTWFPGYQSLLVFFALLGPTYRFDSFSSPGGECHSIQFLDKFSKLWSWLSLSNGFKYHATTLKLKSSAQTFFWTSGCIIQFSTSLVLSDSSKHPKFKTDFRSSFTKSVPPQVNKYLVVVQAQNFEVIFKPPFSYSTN